MEEQIVQQFTLNFRKIIIDEIALDGLEGIIIDLLWRRIEHRISTTLTPKFKEHLWKSLLNVNTISFYKIPSPRGRIEILDRFRIIDDQSGHLRDNDEYLDGPYEFHPVSEAYGSCEHYSKRILITKDELEELTLEEVMAKYGDSLVIVASLKERWQALAPHVSINQLKTLSITHICLLELVGKARENGQMSIGKTNLFKIFKDSKVQYYFRKVLQKLDLIKTSSIMLLCGNRGSIGILLRLKRFHQPRIKNIPKYGPIYDTIQYLKNKPNFCDKVENIVKEKLVARSQLKRLRKCTNMFFFDEKPIEQDDSEKEPEVKKRRLSDNLLVEKYVSFITESDEEDSDDETTGSTAPPVKCQFNVGINIFRQAYETLLEAGLKGLTQIQIGEILGLEFYVSRTICRIFKAKNIVREILEDHGRQRTARYIAIAATSEIDEKFAKEKQKLMDILHESRLISKCKDEPITEEAQASTSNDEPLAKISKLDDDNRLKEEDGITEITIEEQENFVGFSKLLDAKKTPTMRHLKYANGILKVTREKLAVTGFINLSHLVAKEIGESPMDTKALYTLVKRLYADGLIKLFKLKWPGQQQRFSNVICAPHVKATDGVIKALYKEICVRSISNRKVKTSKGLKKEVSDPLQDKPFTMFAYPRYLKLRKLHEFIVKFVYFGDAIPFSDLTPGFASLVHIIPEMPVELALCNISLHSVKEIMPLKVNDKLIKLKLRETPLNVYKLLLQSKSLLASLKANLAMMATFGLIQLCQKEVGIDHHSGVFYVNRNAKLLNTTGTWPRADTDEKALEKRFHFEKLEDVTSYWDTMFHIAVNTVVVNRTKGRSFPVAPIRLVGKVADYDNGEFLGDGRGACGLDSCYFIDMQRHWETMRLSNYKKTATVVHRIKKIKNQKKEIKRQTKSVKKIKKPETKKLVPDKTVAGKRKRLPDLAIKWTKKEDKIIMLCKAATNIMSPSSQPGCLTVRNLMAKDILSMYDQHKTASFCHRRSKSLESNSTLSHERECLINEMKRRPNIISKYEGLLRKLRLSNSLNMTKYIHDARLHGMELVWLLYQVSQSECYNRVMPCVAMNLEEFNAKYSITPTTSNKPFNLYLQSPDCEITVATLKEAIVMTLSLRNDANLDVSKKIYLFLEKYDETTLRIAIDHLRKSGALCTREKYLNNVLKRFSFQDIVKSTSSYKATMATYKLSAAYHRRLLSKLNSDFLENILELLTNELPQNPMPSPQMNCVLLELQACGEIDLEIVTAPYVTGSHGDLIRQSLNPIDIEAHYKLKLGTLKCCCKSEVKIFSDILSCSDCENIIQSIISDAIIYPANLNYPVGDKIIEILSERAERGATFQELRETCGLDTNTLIEKLNSMENEHFIKRVGYQKNLIVLNAFTEKWSLSDLGEHRIIPTPWLTLDGVINIPQFLKWCGAVLNKIVDYPGMSVTRISDDCDYLTNRATQDVCIFLAQTKCIKLKVVTVKQPDLFSDEDLELEEEEYYKFASPESILTIPVKDSFIRFACIKKTLTPVK